MKLKKVMSLVAALCLIGVAAFAQGSAWRGADVSAPVLVKYIGKATETVTITPAAGTVTVAGDSLVPSQAITIGHAGALSVVLAGLNAITNTSGELVIKAVYWEGLAADIASNCLVATAFILKNANVWEKPILWDTDVHLSYSVVPDNPNADGKAFGGYRINGIYGSPVGTGNVTVNVYIDGTSQYQEVITSPVYVYPATLGGTNDTTMTADATVSLGAKANVAGGIQVPTGSRAMVRATRATTATTGGIGASLSRP